MARQYSGTLGKVGSCQIAVSVNAVTDHASCPLDWRLFLPGSWDGTCQDTTEEAEKAAARRPKAQIRDTVWHRSKWEPALEMIDEIAACGRHPPSVLMDAAYAANAPRFGPDSPAGASRTWPR